MQRLRTVTSLDVSAVAGHHAMPAALLFPGCKEEVANVISLFPIVTMGNREITFSKRSQMLFPYFPLLQLLQWEIGK